MERLSYFATAVISAYDAMHYAENLINGLNIFSSTIVLPGIFALHNLLGISESAVVALGIFVIHLFTVTLPVIFSGSIVLSDPSQLLAHWTMPTTGGILRPRTICSSVRRETVFHIGLKH